MDNAEYEKLHYRMWMAKKVRKMMQTHMKKAKDFTYDVDDVLEVIENAIGKLKEIEEGVFLAMPQVDEERYRLKQEMYERLGVENPDRAFRHQDKKTG